MKKNRKNYKKLKKKNPQQKISIKKILKNTSIQKSDSKNYQKKKEKLVILVENKKEQIIVFKERLF